MIQEMVSQRKYRLMAFFFWIGLGRKLPIIDLGCGKVGSLCNGSMQRTFSPQQSLLVGKPK